MDTITRMRAFVAVVEAGGFSAAARGTGRSKALMSKYVAELEEELGARLLNRTTRQLSLTEAGEAAYEEAQEVLRRVARLRENIEATTPMPRGRLRISMPRTFGDGELSRGIMEFLTSYPDIRMELTLEDRFVDLVHEGYDAAIRVSALADSSLIARKLAPFRVVVCATPDVIASHGRPEHPSELCRPALHHRHQCALPRQLAVPATGERRITVPGLRPRGGEQPARHRRRGARRARLLPRAVLVVERGHLAPGAWCRCWRITSCGSSASSSSIRTATACRPSCAPSSTTGGWFEAERKAGRTC